MFFKKPNRPSLEGNRSKIRRKKVVVVKSSRSQDSKDNSDETPDVNGSIDLQNHENGDIELEITPPEDKLTENEKKELEEKRDEFTQLEPETASPVVLTDSECESDKKKKNKPKHRKTMSMSNTIELVKSVGDEWLEAAKREIGEHSKKRENAKKKKESPIAEVNQVGEKIDVVLLLSDATIGESDDFELVPYGNKSCKKKDCKSKELTPKIASSHVMSAQKMGVKMIAKASTVGALNFIRKKRPPPIVDSDNTSDYILLSTELFLESERNHSDLVRVEKKTEIPKEIMSDKSASEEEGEVYYDAKEDSETAEEERVTTHEIKPKIVKSDSRVVIGSRSRKSFGGSLKRSGGGRRRGRRKSAVDEAPPLPPKSTHPTNHDLFVVPKHSHWLFGSSFKGDGKIGAEDGADGAPHIPEVWDKSFDHSADRAEGSHGGVRQRPVIRAESYRDKATKVHRTKRKTSDPNQLTSGNAYNDAEATGNIGAPSGGSSSSSLSSRSNESAAGQPENQDSHSEWSDEEDSAEPWSTKASAEVLVNMSMKERKRQDLIHELITTEISHVRWLRILRRVFLSPLQRTNLLPASELKALFPNLPEVLQRHRKLSADLKTLAATAPVVKTKPLAEALINTLGEPKYPVALAKFCGGQRLALDVLRDRQKRNKELYNFIAKREQEPLCARKRLQDFLACVWQRLTKYQLLLEGISKTITDEDESDPDKEEAVTKIAHALDLAKDILHTVDTAIKTTENDHRLKTIQSKLEVRGVGTESEPGELRRLDLVRHSLVIEGSLLIRQDSTKRLTVHALMLSECLVLLQKESDKYILRPISQVGHQPLSPVVHWNTVFFRTNAAAKNGFFLVNINGVGMYDMSVNNSTEYNTWIRHISEAAKALGPRSNTVEEGPPPPLPSNPPPVTATNTEEPPESSEPNTSVDEEKDEPPIVNEDDGTIVSGATRLIEGETDDSRRPNKFVEEELTKLSSVDIISPPPTLTAYRQLTAEERLRQAEEKVKLALQEAAEAAKDVAESSPSIYSSAMESLLGKMPIDKQWKTSIGNGLNSTAENDRKSSKDLLLTAQSHVNTLTEVLFKALRVSSVGSDCAMTKCSVSPSHGFCDSCFSKHAKFIKTAKHDSFGKGDGSSRPENDLTEKTNNSDQKSDEQNNGKFDSFVMLEEPGESSTDPGEETDLNLVTTSSLGLREILSTLLQRLPAEERERELLRSRLQQADSRLHYLHHVHRDCVHADGEMEKDSLQEVPDFISNDKSSEG